MRPSSLVRGLLAVAVTGSVVLIAGAQPAGAYGGDGQMDVYQIAISQNCNNRTFCRPREIGGFWGWAEFDYNPATGTHTGDAEFAGCSHGEFNGAVHISIDITNWYIAPGSGGPLTFYVTDVMTERFKGDTRTHREKDADTGVPAVQGHYSTEDLFGFSPPPGVSFQLQVAFKPAH